MRRGKKERRVVGGWAGEQTQACGGKRCESIAPAECGGSSSDSSSTAGQSRCAAFAPAYVGDVSQSFEMRCRTGEPPFEERLDVEPERVSSGEYAAADETDDDEKNECAESWRTCGIPDPPLLHAAVVPCADASEDNDVDEGPALRFASRCKRLCGASLYVGGA